MIQTALADIGAILTFGAADLAGRAQRETIARRVIFDYIANHELDAKWTQLATTALQRLAD